MTTNDYYTRWDNLNDEAKATPAAARAQVLMSNGDLAGAVVELDSLVNPFARLFAAMTANQTPVSKIAGATSKTRAYEPSKVARRTRR